ncbi:unnamed protein product [marine sediment metagenome]|uniref:Uncharacterized protein n=1 Tax=marine sediment metagenome TaxID=412755 RepID=X1CHE4_9ZZZZ
MKEEKNKLTKEDVLDVLIDNYPIEDLVYYLTTKFYKTQPKNKDVKCITCGKAIYTHTSISRTELLHLVELAYQHRFNNHDWVKYDEVTRLTKLHWDSNCTKSTQLEHFGVLETSTNMKKTNAIEVEEVKGWLPKVNSKRF